MHYEVSEGKYGPTYTICEGIKIIKTQFGSDQLSVHYKSERDRRGFPKGEEGLKKALRAAELYARKLGIKKDVVVEKAVDIDKVAQEWISSNQARCSTGTRERYYGIVRDFVEPAIGKTPIKDVTRIMVKDFLVGILATHSFKTVELIHTVMSGIFGEAMDRGYIEENPSSGLLKKILPPKRKRSRSEPDPFTKDELALFLETAWKVLTPSLALLMEVMALTGMRLGEALAMRWDYLGASFRKLQDGQNSLR